MALRWLPPNTTRAPRSSRERELVIASARSHAATVAYQERWKKLSLGYNRAVDPAAVPLSHGRDKDAIARGDVDNPVSMGRHDDWWFGGLGSRCQRISDHDIRALDYYLETPAEQLLWSNGTVDRSKDVEVVKAIVRPMDRELVRHAVNHEALLASLVSAATVSIAHRHPEVPQIRLIGDTKVLATLRHLRTSLQDQTAMDLLENKAAVYNLCMAALIAGDLTAARTHLRMLVRSWRGVQANDEQQVRLFYFLRMGDIRIALESGQRPLSDAASFPDTFEGLLTIVDHIGFGPPAKVQAVHAVFKRIVVRGESLRLNQSCQHDTLLGGLEAVRAGLLPRRFSHVVLHYNDTVRFLYQISVMDESTFWKMNMAVHCSLSCLLKLSTYWSDLLSNQSLGRDPVASSQHPAAIGPLWFEYLVVTAYLISMVLRNGEYFATALNKLSQRLRHAIERGPSYVPFALRDAKCSDTPLKTGLYLWILLSAMLASSGDQKMYNWFQRESLRVMRSAQRSSQNTARSLILPFVLADFQPDIILLAENLDRIV